MGTLNPLKAQSSFAERLIDDTVLLRRIIIRMHRKQIRKGTLFTDLAKVFSSQTVYVLVLLGFCRRHMSVYCRRMECMMDSSSL